MALLTQTSVPDRQAVVIGASIAGLVTARVLANHVDRVVVIERDRFSNGDELRNGTPQGHHAHILLARGRQLLDELFPGLQAELAAAGAPLMDFTGDVAQLAPVGWLVRAPSGLTTYAASRPLLETRLRTRVLADPRITIREGCDVVGLLGDQNRQIRRLGDSALAGVSRYFQQQLARSNTTAWTLATGPDLRAPDTEGTPPSWLNRIMYRYLDRVFVQASLISETEGALDSRCIM